MLSCVRIFATPWTAAHQASLSITNSWSLLKLMPSNHLILCHSLLLPSISPRIKVVLMSWPFASDGQNIKVSASASVLLMNIQDWFPLGLTGLVSLQFKRLSSLLQHFKKIKRISSSVLSFLCGPTLTSRHDYWKAITLTRWTFVNKEMSLFFNMLSKFVIVFLPRSKHLLISWLQSTSAAIWECKNVKIFTISIVSLSIYHEVIGMNVMIFIFWILIFKPTLSFSSFTFIKRLFSSPLQG